MKASALITAAIKSSPVKALLAALEIARWTLAEIFEEAAYARFLERHGLQSSREAYADYLHETATNRARKPRCC